MLFDLVRPCAECPFRVNRPGYLKPERAQDIIDGLLRDDWGWFACHKTTGVEEDEYGDDFAIKDETQQCVGSLLLLLHLDAINVPSRIACHTGDLDLSKLDHNAEVAKTREEFIEHHRKGWS